MPEVPIWIGELSGGRSETTPTRSRLKSVRIRMDLQCAQVVCTLLDQWNTIGAPQLGHSAAGCVMLRSPPGYIRAQYSGHSRLRLPGKLASLLRNPTAAAPGS